MGKENELARLPMADGSDLILTDRNLYRRENRGWRGESHLIIPREAITSVSVEWHRKVGFIIGGVIVMLVALTLQLVPLPFSLPSSLAAAVALLGFAIMLLSLLKSNSVQITSPNANIDGAVNDYDAATKFCRLLVKGAMEPAPAGEDEKSEFSAEDRSEDSNWRL